MPLCHLSIRRYLMITTGIAITALCLICYLMISVTIRLWTAQVRLHSSFIRFLRTMTTIAACVVITNFAVTIKQGISTAASLEASRDLTVGIFIVLISVALFKELPVFNEIQKYITTITKAWYQHIGTILATLNMGEKHHECAQHREKRS